MVCEKWIRCSFGFLFFLGVRFVRVFRWSSLVLVEELFVDCFVVGDKFMLEEGMVV